MGILEHHSPRAAGRQDFLTQISRAMLRRGWTGETVLINHKVERKASGQKGQRGHMVFGATCSHAWRLPEQQAIADKWRNPQCTSSSWTIQAGITPQISLLGGSVQRPCRRQVASHPC